MVQTLYWQRLGVIALALAGLSACSPSSPDSASGELQGKVILTGSSTVAPLASELGKRFEQQHPEVRVDVQTGGSSRGLADARSGQADIGMMSRDLAADETDVVAYAVAQDGVAMIVHADNPVTELSPDQLVDIYTGDITEWSAVGGNDTAISVVNKAEGRSTLEVFLKHFDLENSDIQAQVIIGDNEQGIKTVTGNPSAIGYVSIGAAENSIARGEPLKLLPLEGINPSTASVQDGSFPLSRTLNFVTSGEPETLTKAFIDFAQSFEVHDIVEQQNFVPIDFYQ
ncbi:phosphate abc transporter substrate-binding protein [Leptolyngbya sp. Heron Island J]|uniref:phosphate ABC transporter substrate-binding protein n=1 Tax=Leptolyngbya sp. Heron Island J TaxID=1385935 RepID=UPI0003B9E3DF|nr:phosphate ABC transporter substrate-binding protein [Leptolyngbya sp. Heron Island J]ESA34983.1 phosphate abc transporter substrate-binding protein [Leptolyngbya sp. Heron Island J]